MMGTVRTTAPTGQALLRSAEAMVEELRERGREAEELRRLHEQTIAGFASAGFLSAMRPAGAGGSAIGLATFIDIVRTLSRGDASAGWIAAFLISHEWLLTRLPAEAQADVFGAGPYGLAAAVAAPPGAAELVDGGYRVTGRWRFASGIMHANWALLSANTPQGPITMVVPKDELVVHDTWHVPGMKATGSNDVAAKDLFVPAHRAVPFTEYAGANPPGAQLHPSYALLRYPMHRVLSLIHSAVALGVAEAALDLFRASVGQRIRPQTGGRMIEEAGMHSAYGEAHHLVRTARLLLDDAVAITDESYGPCSPGEPGLGRRADLNLSVTGSGYQALAAVDVICRASGASIHRTGNPLERICRDTQVMRNHGVLDWRYFVQTAGSVLLGQGLGGHADAMF
ncbi:hypothetical protein ETD86_03165 [Nonomuraea turkmeniaca]|uniref:Acyl-CoA dehydrogenase C-terminal domain-containing protein n=1 Tax=Nonomuraea turkmeniaca TaxID=103838 RepID=A0A5S4FWB6_9ACTN|nr:hypothetical protein [Nonomuraea turkmeniaca]TMR24939.1 hypothetical protein ETD86_03165 [Nonomuraea turkmeniaca]